LWPEIKVPDPFIFRAVPRVVVVGSINADLVVVAERLPGPGETVSGGRFARHGGGKSANQAVAAARLGAQVALIGAVGDDELGEAAAAELAAEGIDVSGVVRVAEPTGVALIVVDAAGENQIAIAAGANGALGPQHVRELDPTAVLLLGFEVPDAALVAAAQQARGTVILNPAPPREILAEILAAHPILTPNAHEAARLTGETDPEAAARALRERTGAPVAITLGADGVLVLDDDGVQRIPAPEVDVVDTTGAGDTFNGALAAELAAARPLREAAAFAVAAAARSTTGEGARGGMPRREDVCGR
jgi:ribokinase